MNAVFVRKKHTYLRKFKVCKKAKVRKSQIPKLQINTSQKRLGPQYANPQSVTFVGPKTNKLFQSASLRNCDLLNYNNIRTVHICLLLSFVKTDDLKFFKTISFTWQRWAFWYFSSEWCIWRPLLPGLLKHGVLSFNNRKFHWGHI